MYVYTYVRVLTAHVILIKSTEQQEVTRMHLGSVSSRCVCETGKRYVVKHNLITEVYLMTI